MTGILNILAGSIASAIKDGYFNLTTLLLNTNSTNGAQNNTFLDSSSNNFSITRNGNTTQGTFSPFSQNGWSNYFNGTNAYLQVPDNASFEIGSGNFTVEAWIYLTGYSPTYSGSGAAYSAQIINKDDNAARSYNVQLNGTASSWTSLAVTLFSNNSTAVATSASYTFSLNTWYHIAVVRSGTSVRIYVNGVDVGGGTNSTTAQDTSAAVQVGSQSPYWATNGYGYFFPGYISNLRMVKGAAVYTSGFTPSTSALGVYGSGTTALLTCQSNRFVDNGNGNSGSSFTVTVGGTPSVQAFSPFAPTAAYSDSVVGGSGYFDGTGDYLTVADSTALDLTADYTIELWFYPNVTGGLQRLFMVGDYRSTFNGIDLYTNGSSQLVFYSNGASVITGGTVIPYSWNHVALVRSGSGSNNTTLYLNGASVGQATNTTSFTGVTGNGASIGYEYSGTGTSITTAMYVAGARLVKGSAVYTAAFTPPTAPPTNITNTSLLLNFTNAGIYDSTAKNVLETVGNAQVSTTQAKWGTTSMYFDGSGDYLWVTNSTTNFGFGTGDFTIEAWVYRVGNAIDQGLFDFRSGTGTTVKPTLYIDSSNNLTFLMNGATRISGGSVAQNTWVHIALSRASGSTKMFINGTQTGSTYTDTNDYGSTAKCLLGADDDGSSNAFFNGYMDDIRITRGFARYTANFTAPTAAFPVQ